MTTLSVRYKARSGSRQTSLVAVAALMGMGLTLAALGSLLTSAGLAWRIALPVFALLAWWIVARAARAARARRAAIADGAPALTADATGLAFLDWDGQRKRLDWREISGFHIAEIVNEGPWLHVDGSYPNAGIQPVRFAILDLETDADGETLLRDLERMRQASLPVLPL